MLVTGAASGIGRAAARQFAAEGARVVLTDLDEEGLGRVSEEIRAAGGTCVALKADVTSDADVEAMVSRTLQEFGAIHVLVNNAGVGQFMPFHTMQEEDWDLVMEVNAKAIFRCSRAVVPVMIEQNYGRIVNVTSIMGEVAAVAQSAYNASKGAAKMLTQGMARDLAEFNILVNAVAPGMVVTGLTERMFADDEQRAWFEERIPLRRIGQPEEIAPAILFLASDEARYITGATLKVDGGLSAAAG